MSSNRCEHERRVRSHRSNAERALSLGLGRAYRCSDCDKRFWVIAGRAVPHWLPAMGVVVALAFALLQSFNMAGSERTNFSADSENAHESGDVQSPAEIQSSLSPRVGDSASVEVATTSVASIETERSDGGHDPDRAPDVEAARIDRASDRSEPELVEPASDVSKKTEELFMVRLDSDAEGAKRYLVRLVHTGRNVEVTSFILESPTRLVVDLDGVWPKKPGNVSGNRTYGVAGVARMRVGRKSESLRIVIDMESEIPPLHEIRSQDDVVEIIIKQPS